MSHVDTDVSPLPSDLAAESARTWDRPADVSVIPDELRPPMAASPQDRVRALRLRHQLRERRAHEFVADQLSSRKGLPIAEPRRVVRFIGGLLGERKHVVAAVLLANALAAGAGLLVPRLLGALVDSTVADVQAGRQDAALAAANSMALVVAGIVVLQGLLTFAAQASSAVLGQGVLAAAREYVVRAILRLPLSRVESAARRPRHPRHS